MGLEFYFHKSQLPIMEPIWKCLTRPISLNFFETNFSQITQFIPYSGSFSLISWNRLLASFALNFLQKISCIIFAKNRARYQTSTIYVDDTDSMAIFDESFHCRQLLLWPFWWCACTTHICFGPSTQGINPLLLWPKKNLKQPFSK